VEPRSCGQTADSAMIAAARILVRADYPRQGRPTPGTTDRSILASDNRSPTEGLAPSLDVHQVDAVVNAGWCSFGEGIGYPHNVSGIHAPPDLVDAEPAHRNSLIGRAEAAAYR
jgi:hypothetical protein